MIRKAEKLTRGRTQNKVINNKNDWETEQCADHRIMWSRIRMTEKLNNMQNTE